MIKKVRQNVVEPWQGNLMKWEKVFFSEKMSKVNINELELAQQKGQERLFQRVQIAYLKAK